MVRIADERARSVAGRLPADVVEALADPGVPESIVFRGLRHVFTLDMAPLLGGEAFRLGVVDGGGLALAVRGGSGHFGYVDVDEALPLPTPWALANTSPSRFLACHAASEEVFRLAEAGRVAEEDRGDWLERVIRRVDPVVLGDPDNAWSFLIEELKEGII